MANFLSDPYATPTVEPIGPSSAGPISVPAANPNAFGGQIAEGLGKLGEGLNKYASLHNEISADDAVNKYTEQTNHILHGDPNKMIKGPDGTDMPDTGYLGLNGEAALRARPQVEQQLEALRQSLGANMPTDAARYTFETGSRRTSNYALGEIGTHSSKQATEWYSKVNSDTASAATQQIMAHPFDDAVLESAHHDIVNAHVKQALHDTGAVEGSPQYDAAIRDGEKYFLKVKIKAYGPTRPDKSFQLVKDNAQFLGLDYETLYDDYKRKADDYEGRNLAEGVSPPLPANSNPKNSFVIGDSIGEGIRTASGAPGDTTVGLTPNRILTKIQSMKPADFPTGDIILSTGVSNDPKSIGIVADQIKAFTDMGIAPSRIHIVGVGTGPNDSFKNLNVNGQLSDIAKKAGVSFMGPLDPENLSSDGVHPKDYKKISDTIFPPNTPDNLHGSAASLTRTRGMVDASDIPPASSVGANALPTLAIPDAVRSTWGWKQAVEMEKQGGFSEQDLATTAYIESRFGANTGAGQPGHAAQGVMQFMPGTAKKYVHGSPLDPNESYIGAQRLAIDNRQDLNRRLGRDVTGAELYLAHQQGSVGAAALLGHPEMSAVDALTRYAYKGNRALAMQAVRGNIGKNDDSNISAQDFANKWIVTFNNAKATIGGGRSMTMPASVSGAPDRPSTAAMGFAFRDFPITGTNTFAPQTNITTPSLGFSQSDMGSPPTLLTDYNKPDVVAPVSTAEEPAKPKVMPVSEDAIASEIKNGANVPPRPVEVTKQMIADSEAQAYQRIEESGASEEVKTIARAQVAKKATARNIQYETNMRKSADASRIAENDFTTQALTFDRKHDTASLNALVDKIINNDDLNASSKLSLYNLVNKLAGNDEDTYGAGVDDMMKRLTLPADRPDRIKSVGQLETLFANKEINKAGFQLGFSLLKDKQEGYTSSRAVVLNSLFERAKDELVLTQDYAGGKINTDIKGNIAKENAIRDIDTAMTKWVADGNDPTQFPLAIDPKKQDAFFKIYREPAEKEKAKYDALMEREKQESTLAIDTPMYRILAETNVPKPPAGVNPIEWNTMMRNLPKITEKSGTQRYVGADEWATVVTALLRDPKPENISAFNAKFATTQGISHAEDYIKKLGPPEDITRPLPDWSVMSPKNGAPPPNSTWRIY